MSGKKRQWVATMPDGQVAKGYTNRDLRWLIATRMGPDWPAWGPRLVWSPRYWTASQAQLKTIGEKLRGYGFECAVCEVSEVR